jgi:hypothetical protein
MSGRSLLFLLDLVPRQVNAQSDVHSRPATRQYGLPLPAWPRRRAGSPGRDIADARICLPPDPEGPRICLPIIETNARLTAGCLPQHLLGSRLWNARGRSSRVNSDARWAAASRDRDLLVQPRGPVEHEDRLCAALFRTLRDEEPLAAGGRSIPERTRGGRVLVLHSTQRLRNACFDRPPVTRMSALITVPWSA